MLEQFKVLLGREIEDRIANVYINRATSTVLNLTKRKIEEIELLQDVIVDLAIYRFNMQNSTHLKSEGFDGASFSYNTDIPDHLLREIESLKPKKLRVL
ncbi:phage head-tail connector protein [uncultured Clostridium sp.]|uniref:phage head-tail connector protein n=1 Tax=uncultured Clostridium sp. TaxID=59620 RepID=UPI00260C3008|nr:phage head-tail connector protein [uncultured Clostridium sp.]